MKSLRSTGMSTRDRTSVRSLNVPPNRCRSVSTLITSAPPASYSAANPAGSSIGARAPADGLDRLTSAITQTPGPRSRDRASRGSGARAARSFSESNETVS